jgi:3-hydroxyacyl-CoA dehydrogenase
MPKNGEIQNVAIVGTGVIGASWAAEFLAHGFDVVATDPAPNAEPNLRKYIDAAWPALTAKGLAKNASRDRLTFTLGLKKAVSRADFVQENGPERPDFPVVRPQQIQGLLVDRSYVFVSPVGVGVWPAFLGI